MTAKKRNEQLPDITLAEECSWSSGGGGVDSERQQGDILAESFAGASREDLARLANIVNLLPCYVALIDDKHNVVFKNKAFTGFFGAGQLPCYLLMRGLDKPCAYCPPLEAISGGTSSVMEWVHHKSSHAFRVYSYPFEDSDGRKLVLQAGFNITSNVRVQQALNLSEQSYRVITDNLSIGISLVDPTLRIRGGNKRLTQWFGNKFSRNELICDILRCPTYDEALSKTGIFCEDCPFQEAALDNKTSEREFAMTFQDGKEHMVRVVACPVAPKHGPVQALIMMLEDITRRQHIDQQLQRAKKLEAVSTLAGGIAHEINQPLSALHLYVGGLQMLMEKEEQVPADVTSERLGLILHEADRIRGIIAHMRALVMREGKVEMEGVSIGRTVSAVLEIMSKQFSGRRVTLEVDLPDDLPLAHSNGIQMEQVLVNLLSNALHALDNVPVPEGDDQTRGTIRIKAVRQDGERSILLEVADSGPGLPAGSEHIFDPFFSTKEQRQGMGLGLSIVHGFVTLWGGQVYAKPRHRELGGAAFYVEMKPWQGEEEEE